MARVPLGAQIGALKTLVDRPPDALAHLSMRRAEAELLHERLSAALYTLRCLEKHADTVREILWPGQR